MVSTGNKMLVQSILTILLAIESIAQDTAADHTQLVFDVVGLEFDTDTDFEVYEGLLEYLQNPIDLNNADRKELQSLLILSDYQINMLLNHRKTYGPLLSLYELQSIKGFDEKTIKNLQHFVEVKEKSIRSHKLKGYLLGRSHRLIQKKSGYLSNDNNPSFSGSPFSFLFKLRIEKPHRYDLGLSMENDPGEPIQWSPMSSWYGTGFQSGYLRLKEIGLIESVIVGDFRANWGQGLVFGGGFSIGKGRQTTSAHKKISSGLIPYRSSLENGFFRGLGLTLKSGSLRLSTLISSRKLDANMNEKGHVTSLVTSGLHRTSLEMSKRMLVTQNTAGINLNFNPSDSKLDIGISAALTQFSRPIMPENSPENRFKFSGQTSYISGIFGEYRHNNFVLYGEGAITDKKAPGIIFGSLANLSHQMDLIIEYRNYAPNFTSHYATTAFRESTLAQNEKGIYWGMRYSQSKSLTITSYIDIFSFPWLKRTISAPSTGSDYMVSVDFIPTHNFQILTYYRSKKVEKNYTNELIAMPVIDTKERELFKLDMYLDLSEKVRVSSGTWLSRSTGLDDKNMGSLIYSGISFHGSVFSLHLKTILTDSERYSTRFYMYESDVLYAFSVPVYYGKNIRHYILLKSKISQKLSCWLKWSNTNFRDREEIGSGVDRIEGPKKSEIKLQAIYKL